MNKLTACLADEQQSHRKGGLYHKTQVQLAYNSNRIEGSKLTEEQTRYIFETRMIGFKDQDAVPVDDIIHPFQDGNGRVGRLIFFRECLRHDIMPFVIDNEHKMYYYRGLSEFKNTPEFLIGTMQSAQDTYNAWIKYFDEGLSEGLKLE